VTVWEAAIAIIDVVMIGPWRIYPLVHTGEASLPNSYYMEAVSWHLSPIPTTTIFLHYSFQSSTLSLYFCYPSCLIKHMLSLSKETSNRQLPAPLTPSINKALRDLYNRLPHKPPFRALSSSGAFKLYKESCLNSPPPSVVH
jgi:hypothetical protein